MFKEEDFLFLSNIGNLKNIIRYNGPFWNEYDIPRKESVADHTWRMALMLCYFQNKIKLEFNFEKAMKMILIHDIPEIIAGDVPLMHPMRQDKNFENEKSLKEINAMLQICNTEVSKEFLDLFKEYEEQSSNEAIVVKYLDRIEGVLQVFEYRKGDMLKEHFELSLARWQNPNGKDEFLDEVKDFMVNKVEKFFNEKLKS